MLHPTWWSHWLFATSYLGTLSAAIYWSRDLVSAGRSKFYLTLLTAATVLGMVAFIFKGPEYFWMEKSEAIGEAAAAQPNEQAADSDGESTVSEKSKDSERRPSTVVEVPPVAFTKLADEVTRLTDLVGRMAASPSQPSDFRGKPCRRRWLHRRTRWQCRSPCKRS